MIIDVWLGDIHQQIALVILIYDHLFSEESEKMRFSL